jgi:hypothetical protein
LAPIVESADAESRPLDNALGGGRLVLSPGSYYYSELYKSPFADPQSSRTRLTSASLNLSFTPSYHTIVFKLCQHHIMSINEKTADMDVEHAHDDKTTLNQHVDKAAKFLAETQEYPPLSPEAEKKLMRKVDWIMIPIVSSRSELQQPPL